MPENTNNIRKATLTFIFITVALDMLSFGIVIPILPKLILDFEGGNTSDAVAIFGIFSTVFAVMQFLFAPLLGSLSDTVGRRPIILISNIGLGLDYILMALAPSMYFLFIGRVIAGICSASFSIPTAYIADIVPPEKRAASFGILGAAFSLGFIVGPAFGGLLSLYGSRFPFVVAAILCLLNAVYGLFILPESLSIEKRVSFNWKIANPVGALQMLRKDRYLMIISIILFFTGLSGEVMPSIWVLYTNYRFHWDEKTVGISLAIIGACGIIVQGWLAGLSAKKLGDRISLLLGLAFGIIAFIGYSFANSSIAFSLFIPFISLWGISGPATQAIMSKNISESEQGRLQGAVSSLQSVTNMVGPLIFTSIFSLAIGKFIKWNLPGLPFIFATIILTIGFILALFIIPPDEKKSGLKL